MASEYPGVIPCAVLGLYLGFTGLPRLWRFGLGAIPAALLILINNYLTTGNPLSVSYGANANFPEISTGNAMGFDGLDHIKAHAPRFVHSSSHIVGIGLSGAVPDALETKCWIYFPEPQVPFYRATVFSNYSPNNAPAGHWSLMAEVSESPQKPVEMEAIVEESCRRSSAAHPRRR